MAKGQTFQISFLKKANPAKNMPLADRRSGARSDHRTAQLAHQERLVAQLVERVGGLEPGSGNFRRALRFASANLNDSPYAYPAPTHVKARYRLEIDKLELNSQLSKRTALADTLERLQRVGPELGRGDWDREEKLYCKLALLLHLSTGVLHRTTASDGQVAAHRARVAEVVALDGETENYAQQLRELAWEWNKGLDCDAGQAEDELSDWSAGSNEHHGVGSDEEDAPVRMHGGGDEYGAAPVVLDGDRRDRAAPAGAGAQGATGIQDFAPRSAGHGLSPLGYPLPPCALACAVDAQNPCHMAVACAQQEASEDDARLRLWRVQHLVAHEETVVREVLDMLCGSEGRLFGKRVCSDGGDGVGDEVHAIRDASTAHQAASNASSRRRSEFYLRQPIALLHLSPQAVHSMLGHLMARGTKLLHLRHVTSSRIAPDSTVSCTLQALCTAVHEHLSVMDSYLGRLARLVKTQCRVQLSRAGEGGRGNAPSAASITLLVLNNILEHKLKLADTLEQVLEGAMHRKGGEASPAREAHQVFLTRRNRIPFAVPASCTHPTVSTHPTVMAASHRRWGIYTKLQQKQGCKGTQGSTRCCTACLPLPCCRT